MKKLITIIALAVVGISSFGQGYFAFGANPRTIWDDFSGSSAKPAATNVNVAFLWGSASATPLISSIASFVPTNNTGLAINATTAWNDILLDPNFSLATNNTSGLLASGLDTAAGGLVYNASTQFPVLGTSSGTSYHVFLVAWSSAYATPQLAQAAGATLGWSSVFTYSAVTSIGTAASMASSGLTAFGVGQLSGGPVPEPSTMALAALGGASLLLFRRRK